MKYERLDTGGPKHSSDKQVQQHSRKRVAQRRLRSLIIWLLIIAAAVVFYVKGGKELVVGIAQNQWHKTASTREGGKAAGGIFQRKSVKEAEKEFDENR